MNGPIIRIHYDGGDADENVIDMRLLGESLIGLDRIISDGLIAIITERLPKKGERAPLVLKAKEPVQGSFDLLGYLQEAQGLLTLGMPFIMQCGADLVWDWVKGVIDFYGNRREQSEAALEAIVETQRLHLGARDKADERSHEREMIMIQTLRETMGRLANPAAQMVAPVGRSVR